ncbi:lipoprotein-anchoring transpeptidase ErfK/SrfK [Rhodoligotrophos appendicifer]|uniref:L,D-transpeptidase family protein n=1 Tax=Rhodoligotrophos appendicifer TaxID=987056 RepID=UPI00118659E3|nr:L,D-transpeptidase [Rhodoligotrophos appendicifer]
MFTRRNFTASLGALAIATYAAPAARAREPLGSALNVSEPFPLQPVDRSKIAKQFWRQIVQDSSGEDPGVIIVDPEARYLWLVLEGGQALRYGVGVGREGFGWSGDAIIARKAQWPTWTPPAEMIEREPRLREWARGMPGGPENPLGARALYLYENGRDTLYRIHGTSEPWSIGQSVSSGCIRLLNEDVIDLYRRVPVSSRVIVRSSGTQGVS